MKGAVMWIIIAGILGFALLSFTACVSDKKANTGKASQDKKYFGEWVDLNSDTKLTINEKKLILTLGDLPSEYSYRIVKENGTRYLVNIEDEGSFEIMSRIEIKEDGNLSAYEEVMDTNPHQFEFVREERRKKDLEIEDLSTDAPKTVESAIIEQFELQFYNDGVSYGISKDWKRGSYSWEIKQEQDGSYRMNFRIMGDSYIILKYSEKVEDEFVKGLDRLIKEQNLPLLNGYYKANKRRRPGYSLLVWYDSGESLSIGAGGDAASSCVFEIQPFLDYASKLGMKSNFD